MSFLSDSELTELTGYVQPAAQSRFLRQHGIRHIVNAINKVKVTWDAVNGEAAAKRQRPRATLDLEALQEEG